MQTDDEGPVTNKEDSIDTSSEHINNKFDKSDLSKKSDAEDPKPRIVLTFRSEKGAKTSNMKIVTNEEKHEDISPRRSSRTRGMKKESDDDNISHLESEDDNSHDSSQKRSTRQHNKEYSDVIANAIARKEKAYDTAAPTQRLSRRIKPTAKILANEELRMGLESQNNARLGISPDKPAEEGVRTRRSAHTKNVEAKPVVEKKASKRKVQEETAADSSDRESDSSNKKLMHLCNLGLKVKDEESSDNDNRKAENSSYEQEEDEDDEEDDEDEEEDEEIDDDTEVISKLLEADEASDSDEEIPVKKKRSKKNSKSLAPLRRSSRKANSGLYYYDECYEDRDDTGDDSDYAPKRNSSRSNKDDDAALASEGEAETKPEPEVEVPSAEESSEAACPNESSTIVATCYCEESTDLYASPSELTEPVFCQAIELVDGVRVGCSHAAARDARAGLQALRRAGPRSPFFLACRQHAAQLLKHMCCPTCGLFCTQGIFYQCSKQHLFHLECGIPGGDKQKAGCPHCGVHSYRWLPVNRECARVRLDMHCTNKRVFLPEQREQCTPAFLGFSSVDISQLDQEPIPKDLLPSLPSDLKTLLQSVDEEGEVSDHSIQVLYEAIMVGEPVEKLILKIVRGDHINAPLAELEGGTCAHAAAARGRLSALCLLQFAGANIDAVDNGLRTPLMRAILALLDKDTSEEEEKENLDITAVEPSETKEIEDVQEKEMKDEEMNNEETTSGENNEKEDIEMKEDDKEKDDKLDVKENEAKDQTDDITNEKKEEVELKGEEDKEKEHNEDLNKPTDEDLFKVIKYLVAAGCDVNKQGPEEMTALHMAALYGSEAACSILLECGGAAVDPRDHGGWTPLVRAAENKHAHIVKLLLKHGADASASDNEGNLALHWCALSGDARCLALLLRAAPHTIDAPNAHTDTPLHVAAREGHYSCVVILLAHGAKTHLENTAGELPVEVCTGQCLNAITLNMQMTLAVKDKIPRHRILSSDISNGRELHPVPCVNEVDDAPLPDDFVYVSQHVTHAHIPVDDTLDTMQGCACAGECTEGECACCVLGVRRWYVRGRLPPHFPHHDPPMLFECNQTCGCNLKRCSNRVVSRVEATGSLGVRAEVYRTARTGWGLRARQRVARGALVALYRGELLAREQADARGNDQYMFALDLKPDLLEECSDKTQLCVDAARHGSAARFMNHSCRPSVAPVRVFSAARDLRLPAVALFALRDLPAGAPLTFDYGDKFWSVKSKWIKCECESPDCRYPTKTVEEMES